MKMPVFLVTTRLMTNMPVSLVTTRQAPLRAGVDRSMGAQCSVLASAPSRLVRTARLSCTPAGGGTPPSRLGAPLSRRPVVRTARLSCTLAGGGTFVSYKAFAPFASHEGGGTLPREKRAA